MPRRAGLIGASLLVSSAVLAFMFADVFDNMAGLSVGFVARKTTSLTVGWLCLVSGLALYWVIRCLSPKPISRRHVVVCAFSSVLVAWFAFAVIVFAMQDSLVFSPRGLSPARHQRIRHDHPHIEELMIPTEDGNTLHGWLVPAEHGGTQPLMLLFAGQGSEASRYFAFASRLPDLAWAFINYRGYGLSTGKPSDAALFGDAVAIYDYFAARDDIDGANIFALGGSLGTGVATHLAAQRPLAGVILFSPYDRIGGGVAQDMIRFIPTQLLIGNGFDALRYAPIAHAEALAIIGSADTVIRPERSQILMDNWGQPYTQIVIPGGDHYTIYEDERSWQAIRTFVKDRLR